ncbi:DUF3307 domain-containing protein [Pelagovum pacificum]|uniref:DUF3307 domain-containing protein n=1 Tax=Pelagovum pacificum TaxID=2588711 RepID=A0A5C5GB69_9RHOB|nr:DUF3307 domain-containing protein [Pelagovum pacificum]QQA41189.1 DUF3307 domain-containing protein [Pelagovum pacificum]TNY32003.1 DUF3307 domain-containing protein [Pelagovum pacificum]
MTDLLVTLALAHFLGDFVLQTARMAETKHQTKVLLLHIAIHLVLVLALTGAPLLALLIAATHLVIDRIKLMLPESLLTFLADQAAHLAVLVALAAWRSDAAVWHLPDPALALALTLSGLIAATLAGGPAVGLLMKPYQDDAQADGLLRAGRMIGLLERSLIYLLLTTGQAAGIGFLIAAKSILRFDTANKDQRAGEYVIIGTLASFGWAIAITQATMWLGAHLL